MNAWQGVALAVLLLTAAQAQAEDTVHYYYTDPQGTALAKADAAGNVIASYDYAPYGSQAMGAPPSSGPTGYTGHVNDPDTGLVYMQARYYDPEVGRFLSVDPVGVAMGDAFNFNRFAYANNNPIVNDDPTGRAICSTSGGGGCEKIKEQNRARDRAEQGSIEAQAPGSSAFMQLGAGFQASGNLINPSVGIAAEREANKALEGVPKRSESADSLVRGWASAVQPIAEKYDTEIASKIFLVAGGRYEFGPAMSSGVICSRSAVCSVNVWAAGNIAGVLAGYMHTHPDNLGLSGSDVSVAYSMRETNMLMGAFSVYASQPDGHIRKWSTDALKVPHSTNWTWRDYAEHAETLP